MNIDKIVLGSNSEQFYPISLRELTVKRSIDGLPVLSLEALLEESVLKLAEGKPFEFYIRID